MSMAWNGDGRRLWMLVGLFCLAGAGQAGELRVHVGDTAGVSVTDAVISLTPVDSHPPSARKAAAVMDQHELRFVPFVLPVQMGTSVTFPNSDNVRHQVYSFSSSKRFQLALYAGNHASSVLFDRPGIVILGCNIHDWMVGYVVVLDTPYFAKTGDDGTARLSDLPAGTYVARLWQPRIEEGAPMVVDEHMVVGGVVLNREYQLRLHAPDQSNEPPPSLELGLGHRMHPHGN